jgi:peptidoglycan hydrolase-like protein with peptidoglycan-binding domain
MTYQNDDRKAVVMHIQQMLRSLQIYENKPVSVPVDGIFRSKTTDAVREFQLENGLSPTGAVDKKTYDLLYEKSLEADIVTSEPLPLFLLANGQNVSRGEESDFVMILQIILNALTVSYDDYSPLKINGVFDEHTETAVRRFQMRNGLIADGVVNKATWNSLVNNYNKHIKNV